MPCSLIIRRVVLLLVVRIDYTRNATQRKIDTLRLFSKLSNEEGVNFMPSAAPTPNWQPIENLDLIAEHIDGMLEADQEHYETLLEARVRPHVLDDYTVNRIVKVYTTQQDDLGVFDEQLKRWTAQASKYTSAQNQEVGRLVEQMAQVHHIVTSILELAAEIKKGTIETVLAKSDFELGLEALSDKGNRRPPKRKS